MFAVAEGYGLKGMKTFFRDLRRKDVFYRKKLNERFVDK